MLLWENKIEILNHWIWKLFDKYKVEDIDLISEKSYYKKFYNILQAINLLKDNELFCLKYNLYEDCTLCTIANEKIEYLVPYIEIKESDLKLEINLEDIVKRKLTNVQFLCLLCGYDKNGVRTSKC